MVRVPSALLLNTIVQENNSEDTGRTLPAGETNQYTPFQNGGQARLDRIYVSFDLVRLCNNYQVRSVSFSDHSLVSLVFGNYQRKPKFNWDFWKFNITLFHDEVFLDSVKEKIKLLLQENDENSHTVGSF